MNDETHSIELLLGDVCAVLVRRDGSERVLYLLGRVHVLSLLADHERHVLLQGYLAVAVWIYHIWKENGRFKASGYC